HRSPLSIHGVEWLAALTTVAAHRLALPFTASALMAETSDRIDAFIDALWLEDGLAQNTLSAYRQDLEAFEAWLAKQHEKPIVAAEEADIQEWFAAMHPQ